MVLTSLTDVDTLIGSDVQEYEEDIYGTADVELDCLLPTGIYIPMCVDRWVTVREVKRLLWMKAKEFPLYDDLKDQSSCAFVYINSLGEREEIQNEEREISAIQPFLSVLKVIRKEKLTTEQDLTNQVGSLIGKQDFESMRDEEIIEFRRKTKKLCDELNHEKTSISDLNKLISFNYPPDICEDMELRTRVCEALETHNNRLVIEIMHDINGNLGCHRLYMSADKYPDDVINQALQKQYQSRNGQNYEIEDYVLKIVGREEYLLPEGRQSLPLYKYLYIYRSIMKNENPKLAVIKKTDVIRPVARPRKPSAAKVPPRIKSRRPRDDLHEELWGINDKYRVEVTGACQLSVDTDTTVHLKAGIYHGVDIICDLKETPDMIVKDGSAEFNIKLEFDLAVCDLPRMARLCLALYSCKQKPKRTKKNSSAQAKPPTTHRPHKKKYSDSGYMDVHLRKEQDPIGWVNICVFDFKARLTVGTVELRMWPFDETTMLAEGVHVNNLGTVVSNPSKESSVALLELKFSHYGKQNRPIVYPPLEQMINYAASECDNESEYGAIGRFSVTEKEAKERLHELLDNRDPLQPFHENEKEQIWGMKGDICNQYRNSLPKLLSCVRWHSHSDVAQMQALLQVWPPVHQDTALELLDCLYPDKNVRDFAVRCLRDTISDTELRIYLLQLVQALKFENYLECELVYFLIERAIKNRKLGHYLFWLLKSEMHVRSVSVRFGLILEAYLSGSVDHVSVLTQQADTISKLLAVNRLVKNESDHSKGLKGMKEILTGYTQSESFASVSSPLNPALKLAKLRVDNCKFMDSAMKPLWLEWRNGDRFGPDIKIIFKNGDDLRQDMLTLQLLQIMDNIWMSQGLDLRINPYECLSTGRDIGMLEVVQNAETIAKIQKKYCSNLETKFQTAFKKESLYRWLVHNNKEQDALPRAIEEFMLSCAGYCVASYVLGIGDRHSDNIMIKKTGQLFHIDFGHFLGNFKSKFGIKRERAPFVLTTDFVYIIMKGPNQGNIKPFDHFKSLCVQAYLLLRKKGNLLISLFMMMLSTGLPELKSVDDLKYLQDTLKLDVSEAEASKHFQSKFKEALNKSWATSVNWAFHNAVRS